MSFFTAAAINAIYQAATLVDTSTRFVAPRARAAFGKAIKAATKDQCDAFGKSHESMTFGRYQTLTNFVDGMSDATQLTEDQLAELSAHNAAAYLAGVAFKSEARQSRVDLQPIRDAVAKCSELYGECSDAWFASAAA